MPAAKGTGERAYKRGYSPPAHLRDVIASAHQRRLWLTAFTALADNTVALALAIGGALTVRTLVVPIAMIVLPVAVIAIGRQLRALECLVHEASHFNWSRHYRCMNDVLGFLLAGLPTGVLVREYRTSHLLHHGRFGTADDPDRARYQELCWEALRRDSWASFWSGVIPRLYCYQLGWLRALRTNPFSLGMLVAWLGMVAILPFIAFTGDVTGGVLTALVWLLGYGLALPVIRFIGESSEHIYSDSETVFDATISNLGLLQRFLIHPHNDGYHTVHHMWPGVPHHALRRLHKVLTVEDPECYAQKLRYRTRVLQYPVRNSEGSSSPPT